VGWIIDMFHSAHRYSSKFKVQSSKL
jgi:hypothetical protein